MNTEKPILSIEQIYSIGRMTIAVMEGLTTITLTAAVQNKELINLPNNYYPILSALFILAVAREGYVYFTNKPH